MVSIEKQVKITIDGEDVQVLSDICELARIQLSDDSRIVSRFDQRQTNAIRALMERLFDA